MSTSPLIVRNGRHLWTLSIFSQRYFFSEKGDRLRVGIDLATFRFQIQRFGRLHFNSLSRPPFNASIKFFA